MMDVLARTRERVGARQLQRGRQHATERVVAVRAQLGSCVRFQKSDQVAFDFDRPVEITFAKVQIRIKQQLEERPNVAKPDGRNGVARSGDRGTIADLNANGQIAACADHRARERSSQPGAGDVVRCSCGLDGAERLATMSLTRLDAAYRIQFFHCFYL